MRVRFGGKKIWTADGNVVYESMAFPCNHAKITEIIVFSPNREKMYSKDIFKESKNKHLSTIKEYVLERKGDEVSNDVPSWVN